MDILLTGATGYIGSAVLAALVERGHRVMALVRSGTSASRVEAAGAVALQGDITDVSWLASHLTAAEGAIHTASPGDDTSAAVDAAVVTAVVSAFGGTSKPYVHTGGIWVQGDGHDITEETPIRPPAIVAWREAVEDDLLTADVAATVLEPAVVHGHDAGIPALLASAPRTDDGVLTVIGDGSQHWTTVHVDDLAALYLLVLEGSPVGRVIGASGHNPTVGELGEAISRGPVAAEGDAASRARLGDLFAEALLLDQQAAGAKARSLGWNPVHPTLVEEIAAGHYRG